MDGHGAREIGRRRRPHGAAGRLSAPAGRRATWCSCPGPAPGVPTGRSTARSSVPDGAVDARHPGADAGRARQHRRPPRRGRPDARRRRRRDLVPRDDGRLRRLQRGLRRSTSPPRPVRRARPSPSPPLPHPHLAIEIKAIAHDAEGSRDATRSTSPAGSRSTASSCTRRSATPRSGTRATSSSPSSAARTSAPTSTTTRATSSSTSCAATWCCASGRTARRATSRSARARCSCCRPTCATRRSGRWPARSAWSSSGRARPGEPDGFEWYCPPCRVARAPQRGAARQPRRRPAEGLRRVLRRRRGAHLSGLRMGPPRSRGAARPAAGRRGLAALGSP